MFCFFQIFILFCFTCKSDLFSSGESPWILRMEIFNNNVAGWERDKERKVITFDSFIFSHTYIGNNSFMLMNNFSFRVLWLLCDPLTYLLHNIIMPPLRSWCCKAQAHKWLSSWYSFFSATKSDCFNWMLEEMSWWKIYERRI